MTTTVVQALRDLLAFLLGEAPLDGVWFGDPHPAEKGKFWWRTHLRAALAEHDAQAQAVPDCKPCVYNGGTCTRRGCGPGAFCQAAGLAQRTAPPPATPLSSLRGMASLPPGASSESIVESSRAAQATPPAAAQPDDVLEALELDPDTYRTEGGAINKGKLRAAILHPYNYLPPDHWMQARFSKPGGRPATQPVAAQPAPSAQGDAQWISVKDRLPQKFTEVLVCFAGHPIPSTGQYTGNQRDMNGWCYPVENNGTNDDGTDPTVTHWMPLPEPPSDAAIEAKKGEAA